MTLLKVARRDSFSEAEAAQSLGITTFELHQLLDRFIFNEGTPRPANIEFTSSDLLLLAYWNEESNEPAEKKSCSNVISILDHK